MITTLKEFIVSHKAIKDKHEDQYSSVEVRVSFNGTISYRIWCPKLEKHFESSSPESTIEQYRNNLEGTVPDMVIVEEAPVRNLYEPAPLTVSDDYLVTEEDMPFAKPNFDDIPF